jgi:cytochrome c biogenesis protein CcmG, thiol:disulfide interchange protein DsbE
MRRSLAWIPLALFAFIAGISIYGLQRTKDNTVYSNMIGQPLPSFDLPAATRNTIGLRSTDFSDGKPRLLNVFASWCIPCRAEAPQLDTLKARGVEIFGVAIRDKPEDVTSFLTQNGNPFVRIGADADMKLQLTLGSSGVPETYVIGGDGLILYQHVGDIRAEHVPMLLQKLREAK